MNKLIYLIPILCFLFIFFSLNDPDTEDEYSRYHWAESASILWAESRNIKATDVHCEQLYSTVQVCRVNNRYNITCYERLANEFHACYEITTLYSKQRDL